MNNQFLSPLEQPLCAHQGCTALPTHQHRTGRLYTFHCPEHAALEEQRMEAYSRSLQGIAGTPGPSAAERRKVLTENLMAELGL